MLDNTFGKIEVLSKKKNPESSYVDFNEEQTREGWQSNQELTMRINERQPVLQLNL